MIIDPEINGLSPSTSVAGLSATSNAATDHDKLATPSPDPPPYTAIDVTFGESVMEDRLGEVIPSTASSQFCRFEPDMVHPRDRSWSTNEITPDASVALQTPGLEEIQEGGRQILNSIQLLIATSLVAAGGVIEGIGKIVAGFGRAIASRLAPGSHKGL